jgi:hypothetical protein
MSRPGGPAVSIQKQCYFFAGEALAAGEAVVEAPLAGLAEAAGLVAGEAAGDAAGEPEGAAAGFEAGVGCFNGEGPSLTTEEVPKPGMEKSKARNIKIIAATTVAFSSGFCAPRGPNAVWLPDPPKAAATSPPFPDCKRITRIRKRHTNTKTILSKMSNTNYLPD